LRRKQLVAVPLTDAEEVPDGDPLPIDARRRPPRSRRSRNYQIRLREPATLFSRASVYSSLKETPPNTSARRPGPVGACSDATRLSGSRRKWAAQSNCAPSHLCGWLGLIADWGADRRIEAQVQGREKSQESKSVTFCTKKRVVFGRFHSSLPH